MPVKYRNANEAGRFRVQVECPNCGSRCLVYSSERTSSRSRQYYVSCLNHLCGWRGIGIFEVIKTTHPPPAPMRQGEIPETVPDEFFHDPPPLDGNLF